MGVHTISGQQESDEGGKKVNRRQIPELPFSPGEARIVDVSKRGRTEVITYEYNGKRFQEERVPITPPTLGVELQSRLERLKKSMQPEINLDDEATVRLYNALNFPPWSITPDAIRNRPEVREALANSLLRRIANAVGTNDPVILKKALEVDLGFKYPPITTFKIGTRVRSPRIPGKTEP